MESRLYRFLLGYNVTPQATTGVAHSIALMGRRLRRRLDLVVPDVGSRVREKQGKMKQYHDVKVKDRTFYVGDPVYAKNFCGTGTPKWIPGVNERKLGPVSFIIKLSDGREWRRHQDHLRIHPNLCETEDGEPQNPLLPKTVYSKDKLVTHAVPGKDNITTPFMESAIPDPNMFPKPQMFSLPSPEPEISKNQSPKKTMNSPEISIKTTPVFRRSQRNVKPPHKLNL